MIMLTEILIPVITSCFLRRSLRSLPRQQTFRKPSMLQDLERGRKTEIDFINGYVMTLGQASGVQVHMNTTITNLIHQIERGNLQSGQDRMNDLAVQTAD